MNRELEAYASDFRAAMKVPAWFVAGRLHLSIGNGAERPRSIHCRRDLRVCRLFRRPDIYGWTKAILVVVLIVGVPRHVHT